MACKKLKIVVLLITVAMAVNSCKEKSTTLFELLDAEQTGIHFANTITENDSTNILDYEYVYNGAGVAVADFNNDGLEDLYFTASMTSNRLYLNKSNLSFQDVTKESATDGQQKWCTGVAVIDINNDGWKDLYICASRYNNADRRRNILYINKGVNSNGVPVFNDEAAAYGLADTTFSTQAAFFDYDKDGDLDMYLLVSGKMQEGYQPNTYSKKITDGSSVTNDRLYRNDQPAGSAHPVFTDVTKDAGILIEGFGLGVSITDINLDGWPDVYVTNDYLSNDLLWINNKNGTFTNKAGAYFKHTSFSAMGNDVQDLNNDGLMDIVALDMLPKDNFRKKMMSPPGNYAAYNNNDYFGYEPQYVRNTLQLNLGKTSDTGATIFSEIALQSGIAETDWSWAPLVADFDNDGYRDIIITNGFPKDLSDRDFLSFRQSASTVATKKDIIDAIPVVKIADYAFRNNKNLGFEDVSKAWGFNKPAFSNGAVYADFDNDGDLDCVINNINDAAHFYRNNLIEKTADSTHWLKLKFEGTGTNKIGLGATAMLYLNNGTKLPYEHSIHRGYLSSLSSIAHFGLGAATIDSLFIRWPDDKIQVVRKPPVDSTLVIKYANAVEGSYVNAGQSTVFTDLSSVLSSVYKHEETDYVDFNVQKLLPHKLSQYGPALAVGDVDGNGTEDLFAGGAKGFAGKLMLQDKSGKFSVKNLASVSAKQQEDMGALFFDADNDNDLDLYIVSGGVESDKGSADFNDRFYVNDGKGNFRSDSTVLPSLFVSGAAVKGADFDNDGDIDLIRTGRVEPGMYPTPVASFILRNDSEKGKPKFADISAEVASNLSKAGMVTDALWTDFDNDGWIDVILTREWQSPMFLKNDKGKFKDITANTGVQELSGWWNSIAAGDFDNDGDIDYALGNAGQNTLYKADKDHPVQIYAADFNADGSFDAIPTVFYADSAGNRKEYPAFGRDDMIKQMIPIRRKFIRYADFAYVTVNEILSPVDKKKALHYEATTLSSIYLENLGTGRFKMHELPAEAQVAPLYGMLAWDADGDGNLDLLINGNDHGVELSVGKCDALNGLCLKGDGKGNFKAMKHAESGFYIPGDGKALIAITGSNEQPKIIGSQNRRELRVFAPVKPLKIVKTSAADRIALLHLKNKRTQRVELYYGSSFLSQTTRNLFLSETVDYVELIDSKYQKKVVRF